MVLNSVVINCMRSFRNANLKTKHVNNIEHPRTLLYIRYDAYSIEGVSRHDIDTMIEYIATVKLL